MSNLSITASSGLKFPPSVGPQANFFNPQILGIVSKFLSLKEGMEARATCLSFCKRLLTNYSGSRSVSIRDFGSIDRAIEVLGTLQETGLKIEAIDLNDCPKITDAQLEKLGKACPNIHTITLARCKQITDAGLAALGATCPNILTIDLSWCEQITDVGLEGLGKACPSIHTIYLRGCEQITDACLAAIGAACPNIHTIDLSWCEQITDAGLTALRATCPYIRTIHLRRCVLITDAGRAVFGNMVQVLA